METSEPTDSAEAPETNQSEDLARRNQELEEHIGEAEKAVDRRRDEIGEARPEHRERDTNPDVH
jgi:hypothetical protein